jgi:hypothetical protein
MQLQHQYAIVTKNRKNSVREAPTAHNKPFKKLNLQEGGGTTKK